MKKAVKIKMAPEHALARRRAFARNYATIRGYAIELIKLVHYRDADKRDIGFDYPYILDHILRKFPKVVSSGPHQGQPTKMTVKELHEIAWELNRNGVKLPFRPRRKSISKKDKRP
jgi:hypothetical protein